MDTRLFRKISYGVYLVSSIKGDRINAQIANAIIQITASPPQIVLGICKENLTHSFIKESRAFAVSILSQEAPLSLIGKFGFKSGRDVNKFDGVPYLLGENGCPVFQEHTVGYLEGTVTKELDSGTHSLFVGRVTDAKTFNDNDPMTYAFYHEVKRGTTPKTAPTFLETKKEEKEEKTMEKYRCTVCGYIYDPEKGDSDGGIAPGTSFEELPDDWVCPICGAAKDQFEPE